MTPGLSRDSEAVEAGATTDLLDSIDAGDLRQERRKRVSAQDAVTGVDQLLEPDPVMNRIT